MNLRIGDEVAFKSAFMSSEVLIGTGECAVIKGMDEESGDFVLQMRNFYPELSDYNNMVSMTGQKAKQTLKRLWPMATKIGYRYITVAACVVVFMVGYMIPPPITFAKPPNQQALLLDLVQDLDNLTTYKERPATYAPLRNMVKERCVAMQSD